jgi:hypothetical protein
MHTKPRSFSYTTLVYSDLCLRELLPASKSPFNMGIGMGIGMLMFIGDVVPRSGDLRQNFSTRMALRSPPIPLSSSIKLDYAFLLFPNPYRVTICSWPTQIYLDLGFHPSIMTAEHRSSTQVAAREPQYELVRKAG